MVRDVFGQGDRLPWLRRNGIHHLPHIVGTATCIGVGTDGLDHVISATDQRHLAVLRRMAQKNALGIGIRFLWEEWSFGEAAGSAWVALGGLRNRVVDYFG